MAGRVKRLPVTLEQRHVLLERLRREVGDVVEDLTGTAETMRVLSAPERRTPREEATARLISSEQTRLREELVRLWGEYETVAARAAPRRRSSSRKAA